jgi:hypothetical protein
MRRQLGQVSVTKTSMCIGCSMRLTRWLRVRPERPLLTISIAFEQNRQLGPPSRHEAQP